MMESGIEILRYQMFDQAIDDIASYGLLGIADIGCLNLSH
jgi:hypothetical protein